MLIVICDNGHDDDLTGIKITFAAYVLNKSLMGDTGYVIVMTSYHSVMYHVSN